MQNNKPSWQEIKHFYPEKIKKFYFYNHEYNNIHKSRFCNINNPDDFREKDLSNYKIHRIKQKAQKKVPVRKILNRKKYPILFNKVIQEIIDLYSKQYFFLCKGYLIMENKAYMNIKALNRNIKIFVDFYIKNDGNPSLKNKTEKTPIGKLMSMEKNIKRSLKEKKEKFKKLISKTTMKKFTPLSEEFKKYKKKQKIKTIVLKPAIIIAGLRSEWHNTTAYKFMTKKCTLSKKNKQNKNYCSLQILHAEYKIYKILLKNIRESIDKLKAHDLKQKDFYERVNFLLQEIIT